MKSFVLVLILIPFASSIAQNNSSVLADNYFALGNYSKAINEYSKLGDLKSLHQIARSYEAIGNHEKAILQYQAVVKKDSTNILAQFELGKIFDKTKKYEDAENLFGILILKSPDNPEFQYFLGKAFRYNSDFDRGKESLKKAVQLDSTHLRSIYLLGKLYLAVDEPSNALDITNTGLRTAPEDVALINLKALALFTLGKFEEAIPLFEKLVEVGEGKPFVLKKLGEASAQRWQYEKAKKAYNRLGDIENYEADAYKGLAEVYMKEDVLDSAAIYYKKSIKERRYNFQEEYASLGRIFRIQKDTKKALDYYTLAWEENPANQFAYWQVCVMADEYYKDPELKLKYYEKLLADFKDLMPFLKERAQKRVNELKEELHFAKE
ncbi:tetratricopeptide repeat protein [Croceivirga thetidis]|uniref:Tetratricopeptide repeat protein n=1 Tax=Croceivirga thetidis TaxID=2721623 RepID=A0ABX1GP49_9FLAO|nr:tetratricopeptide repeat protein [Croceivirga thetidis]NKI30735.1 tetratricopeptide repeat protein [Croceivirga thetidis]